MPAIDRIRAALSSEHCSAWARNTIEDILDRARSYGGTVTAGQDKLIWKLVEEVEAKAARPAAQLLDLTRVMEMFATASKALKRPFVVFATYKPHPDPVLAAKGKKVVDQEFRASLAPATGKNPGAIYIKARGEYAGKISPAGAFSPTREAPEALRTALTNFAANPQGEATAYGQATGSCCFCARELTDPRSVGVGYGPICASRFGLPWGVQALVCEEA